MSIQDKLNVIEKEKIEYYNKIHELRKREMRLLKDLEKENK